MYTNTDALIMAAGMGMRMLPLTEKHPKPLIPLCGTTLIETIINALIVHKISNIIIVVGYKGEQFDFLKQKYPNITLIENKEYQQKNNISSLMAAADSLGERDCFICEADLFISDNSIFSGVTESCYFGKFVNGHSDDWVFETKDDKIVEIRKKGENLFNMTGVSFWKKKDLQILISALRETYRKEGHENLFWDEVVNANLDKLSLCIKPVKNEQIIELDTVAELEEFVRTRG